MKSIQNISSGRVVLFDGSINLDMGKSKTISDELFLKQELQDVINAGWIKVTNDTAPDIDAKSNLEAMVIEKNPLEGSLEFPVKEPVLEETPVEATPAVKPVKAPKAKKEVTTEE